MFTVSFETDNAAFTDDQDSNAARCVESASILRHLARRLDEGYTSGHVFDTNGNTIGSWLLTE